MIKETAIFLGVVFIWWCVVKGWPMMVEGLK